MSTTVSLDQWIIKDSGREVGALEIHPCRAEDPRGRARAHTEECKRIVQDKAAHELPWEEEKRSRSQQPTYLGEIKS